MSGQTGQSLATFLLSVPVAAIGLMAVFGIPQFAAVIAAQRGADPGADPLDDPLLQIREESTRTPGAYDPAFPQSDAAGSDEGAPRWNTPREDLRESSLSEERTPQPNDFWDDRQGDFHSNEGTSSAGDLQAPSPWGDSHRPAPPGLTWKEARLQLCELGVDDFHLEAGSVPDTFTFVAVFTPGDQPDVTYRFEAEAPDPLLAVEDVVAQIEDWLADRFASSGQYRSANSPSRSNLRW